MSRTIKLEDKKIILDAAGDPIMIQDTDKLLQDFENLVRIPLGRHNFHANLGTRIEDLIGLPYSNEVIKNFVKNELNSIVSQLSQLQGIQATYQAVSSAELIKELENVEITDLSPYSITFAATIRSQVEEEVRIIENF